MSNWDTIKSYQRQAWQPQAAAMDELGSGLIGTQTGIDNGYSSHALTCVMTAADGTIWTATSTGTAAGLAGSLLSNNAETMSSVIQENPDNVSATDPNGP